MISRTAYKAIRPLLFSKDPEVVHDRVIRLGSILGSNALTRRMTSLFCSYSDPALEQEILGIRFRNPIGLAAGFDKDAQLSQILGPVGFGFAELGSITAKPCEGNPKPRLWRLKQDKSLVVNYGLKNQGSEIIARRLEERQHDIPIGISIAKTNCKETADTEEAVKDYVKSHRRFAKIGDYTTINISCPNAYAGQPFTDARRLERLLSEMTKVKTGKPTFLKLSPDMSPSEIESITKVGEKHSMDGYVCSNLTKRRDKLKGAPNKGGIAGKALRNRSDDLISQVYKRTKGKKLIIGCGGVFSAEDAYRKMRLGASLIQLITGMIYEGPQLIGEINKGLVKILGKTKISDIVGIDQE